MYRSANDPEIQNMNPQDLELLRSKNRVMNDEYMTGTKQKTVAQRIAEKARQKMADAQDKISDIKNQK